MNRFHPVFRHSLLLFVSCLATASGLSGCSDSGDADSNPEQEGDGDSTSGDGDGATGGGAVTTEREPSGKACPRSERVGGFVLALAEDYTTFRGAVSTGVTPAGVPELISQSGTCELLGPPELFCEETCASGTTCGPDGDCVAEAVKVSAGTATVQGLATDLAEEPNGITFEYAETINEPYPAFEIDSKLIVSTSGGEAQAVILVGEGVGLMATKAEEFPLVDSEALALTWETEGASENSVVEISLTVNAHGGTPARIECQSDDSGSFEIPADILTELVNQGLSGFPRVTLTRQTLDSVDVDAGCVDLKVNSSITVPISIDGLVSCSGDEDCPDGQTCSAELVCE